MPPLLLDVHLARALAEALVRHGIDARHIADWQGGRWQKAADEVILAVAMSAGRILVTLDSATLPAIAYRWTAEGRSHAGLLVLSSRINQSDIGGQLHTILAMLAEMADQPWTNAVVYARRQR